MLKLPNSKGEPGTRAWFRVLAKNGKDAEVLIYDEIGAGFFGGGVAASDLIKQLQALKLESGDQLTVRINSPGGNMFEGFAIHNYLRTVKARTVARIDGVAASAASIIAMAADTVEMPSNSMLFIHNPWMWAAGDAKVMRKAADDLEQMRDSAATSYMRKAGDKLTQDELTAMLDVETWLSAEDAVKYGLADTVDEPVRAAALAQFDFSQYGFPVPKALAALKEASARERKAMRAKLESLKT